jgi:hypothetical protein
MLYINDNRMVKEKKIIFSTIVYPTEASETNAVLLIESIRKYAGSLSDTPIWCFIPRYEKKISRTRMDSMKASGAEIITFDIDIQHARFPFSADAYAAALAELQATGLADILVWLGTNTIVLREPHAFILPRGKYLAYRPVHHILIGSQYYERLDPFWTAVYRHCNVPEDRVFRITTHIDAVKIRPYFNAGILVTTLEKPVFRSWRDTFFQVNRDPEFTAFYSQDERYRIFMHQAVLSGVILSTFKKEEIQELPHEYNYPVHLYDDDVTDHKPSKLEELVTFRHEGFQKYPVWFKKIPANESLKKWIAERL